MNDRFEKIIAELRNVSLDEKEKVSLRTDFISYLEGLPAPKQSFLLKSPYTDFSLFFLHRRNQAVIASLFFVLVIGGGMAVEAEKALPGDVLYPVKTNVNEKVVRVFQKASPEREAKFEISLVEKRLVEAEVLERKNNLTDDHKKVIKRELAKQTVRADEAISTLNTIRVEMEKPTKALLPENKKIRKEKTEENNEGKNGEDVSNSSLMMSVKIEKEGEDKEAEVSEEIPEEVEKLEKILDNHSGIIKKLNNRN